MSHGSRRLLGPALIVAIVAISTAAVLFRLAPDVPPLTAAGDRLLIAGLILSLLVRGRLARVPWNLAIPAGVAYAVHFGSWVASLGLTSVAASVTAVTTSPILLAGFGLATGRDAPSRRTLAAMALAVAGVVWLTTTSGDGRPAHGLGIALGLLGALAIAIYYLIVRRAGVELDALAFSCAATLVGGALLLTTALAIGEPLLPPTLTDVWVVVGAAALPQLVGHTLMTWALRHATPTTVALATLGEPAGASFLAALIVDERLSLAGALACGLTLVGVALAALRPDRGDAPQPESSARE